MMPIFASEGGYQAFTLGSAERGWLYFALAAGALALVVAVGLMRQVLAADQGTSLMREIAAAIQEGAVAFLKRQFRAIGIVVVPLAVLVFFTATKVVNSTNGHVALSFGQSGLYRALAFLLGATFSGLTGIIGMNLSVRGNVRTAAAARSGELPRALRVAFRSGGVTGLFCVGLGLIGAAGLTLIFQNTATAVLIGFGFGGSLIALFMRVGGGIFTKAADVGADLVGKVEAGIPEDDPRNAATIADNVGDNVGDCAGMAADLFESYAIMIIASIILGYSAFHSIGIDPAKGVVFPLIVAGFGIIASIGAIFSVRARRRDRTAMSAINRGYRLGGVAVLVAAFLVAQFYVKDLKVFWAVLIGVALGQVASLITEYFTSTERAPVREIAEAARTGPATTILAGLSSGLESSVFAIIAIATAIGLSIIISLETAHGNIELTLYLVALTGMGLLSTTGMVVSEDSFGPVSDNAAGIAEMAGEFGGDAERVLVSLDAVGNTTKAITKGVAIASAVLATVALFASFVETIGNQLNLRATGSALFHEAATQINVANPTTFLGVLIGGSIAFLFSGLAIRAVGRHRRPGGAPPVPRAPRDHGWHREARIRAGHQHLHPRRPTGARHAGAACHPGAGHRRVRDQLPRPRCLPRRGDPHRPADGRVPVELRRRLGQRQEVHRGRPRGRQGIGCPQGRHHRRHRRRPVQGHRRPGAQPPHQGDEPRLAAHSPRGDHVPLPPGHPLLDRRSRARRPARGHRLLQAPDDVVRRRTCRRFRAGRRGRARGRADSLSHQSAPGGRPGAPIGPTSPMGAGPGAASDDHDGRAIFSGAGTDTSVLRRKRPKWRRCIAGEARAVTGRRSRDRRVRA